jgi:hypothetical protein
MRRDKRHVPKWVSAVLALCLLPVAGAAWAQGTPPPHAVPGWYLGMPVLLTARESPADVERQTLPSMPVYITAPVSASAGTSPERLVALPRGEVVLPPHQDTLVTMASANEPLLAIGYFVEIGPAGDEHTVRTQPQPENAWPSAPLASAIRIGTEWVPLNNHIVIEYGVKTGLLQLEFFDVGGLMWGQHFDGTDAGVEVAACAFEHPPELPDVDWAGDIQHLPGQN